MRVGGKGGGKRQPDDKDRRFSDFGNSHCVASSLQGSRLASPTNVIHGAVPKARRVILFGRGPDWYSEINPLQQWWK